MADKPDKPDDETTTATADGYAAEEAKAQTAARGALAEADKNAPIKPPSTVVEEHPGKVQMFNVSREQLEKVRGSSGSDDLAIGIFFATLAGSAIVTLATNPPANAVLLLGYWVAAIFGLPFGALLVWKWHRSSANGDAAFKRIVGDDK